MERAMRKTVFDMDDVLWDMNGRVCTRLGIDESKVVTFKVYENPYLSDAEKELLKSGYGNVDMFRDIVWYKGIEKMKILMDMGMDCSVNSNCCGQDIYEVKEPQLNEQLQLPDGHITLNVIGIDTHNKKKDIGEDVDFFVDDSPYNVLASKAKLNIMPIKYWNYNEPAREIVKDKNVIYLPTLDDIMDFLIGKMYIYNRSVGL